MTSEVLAALIRVNVVGAALVLAVLALRIPVRRRFGPEIAYWLWAAPPLAALATLAPAPVVTDAPEADLIVRAVSGVALPTLIVWAAGCVAAVVALARSQMRFASAARAGRAGPAVMGVISPRVVMPADGGFSAEERALIRAHERQHVERQDPRAAAAGALLQALFWFNPFVHLGVRAMRLDQELACDAAVLRARPHQDRALYARTLLKSQLAAQGLPFGCMWPARGRHPLETRIGLIRAARRADDGLAGPMLLSALIVASVWAAWRIQPPDPPPAAMVEFWRTQHEPAMSVMLVPAPRP